LPDLVDVMIIFSLAVYSRVRKSTRSHWSSSAGGRADFLHDSGQLCPVSMIITYSVAKSMMDSIQDMALASKRLSWISLSCVRGCVLGTEPVGLTRMKLMDMRDDVR